MKTKLIALLALLSTSVTIFAQTTALTINSSTGLVNVPAGVTPNFAAIRIDGKQASAMPTPQGFGAIADGTSHPVSEWLTSGAHSRGYADLAAIQADYPQVASLSDESDWAATQRVLNIHKSVYLPPADRNGGGYVFNRPLVTQDDGQQILGGGRQGPYGTGAGTHILVAPGIDGIRVVTHACSIRDLTVTGSSVAIHRVTSTGGLQAVMETSAPHGFDGTAITISGNTTGTTGIDPATSTTVATAVSHHLTDGDFIQIAGSSETGLNGVWRIRTTDSTHFKILTPDQGEVGVATNGGIASFVRVYEVAVGPDFVNGVLGSAPDKLTGVYHVTVVTGTTLKVFTEDNSPVVLTSNATNDTGTLYTSRHLIHFGGGNDFDNEEHSPDSAHSFYLSNLLARYAQCGFYLGTNDASGGEHLVAATVGVGLWADGALDNLPFSACWMTECSSSGYRVTRNSGLVLTGGGGADNNCFVDMSRDVGNRFIGNGNYFEGIMRSGPASSSAPTSSIYVEGGGNNLVLMRGLTVQDGGVPDNCHFHGSTGTTIKVEACGPGLHCWQQCLHVYGDNASAMVVSYYGAASNDYSVGKYQASDADVHDSTETFGGGIPAAALSNVGMKVLVIPYGGGTTPSGLYQVLNNTGTPAWYRIGFDNLEVARGGTGQTSFTAGDLLYATGSTALTKLPKGADGQVLTIDGPSHLPVWADAPGSQTTFTASIDSPANLSGSTTLANVSGLTINPTGGVPAGKYVIIIDGAIGFGPGGAGYKWDLKGGTAVFGAATGDYRRTLQWNHSALQYNVSVFGDDGSVDGSLVDGEIWGAPTDTPAGPPAGRLAMHYEGMIHVTTAGSIVFRHANTNGSGDTGQLLGDTHITLIKQ